MSRTAVIAFLATAFFAAAAPARAAEDPAVIRGVYFTETGCNHCDAFLYAGKARLEAEYSVSIELESHDILTDSGYALCVRMLAERDLEFTSFPVLFIGDAAYRGSTAIERHLGPDIQAYARDGVWPATRPRSEVSAPADPKTRGGDRATAADAASAGGDLREALAGGAFAAAVLPILLAGLLDGINPCAFSTLLFFLSFVSLRKKRREAVLFTGLAFIAGVFVAYFCIGFGLLASLRAAFSAGRLSLYLNGAVTAAALALAFLNLRDARRGSRGKPEESTLKLPKPLRDASHSIIRHFAGGPAGIAAAALAGGTVSLIELACTGQIYLPTLAYLNRTAFTSRSLALLLAYNAAFALPLVLVFVLFTVGLTHERIQAWYRRRIAAVRILSALFFLAMGVLVWIV